MWFRAAAEEGRGGIDFGVPVVPEVKAMWPGQDGEEGGGEQMGVEGAKGGGDIIVKGKDGLIVTTTMEEDAAQARAVGVVAGDAMMMRTLADVHMSSRRAIGMSGSAESEQNTF